MTLSAAFFRLISTVSPTRTRRSGLPDLHVGTQRVTSPGASSTLAFRAGNIGSFAYFCDLPGHREAGMEGMIKVSPAEAAPAPADISRDPADLPPPIAERGPETVRSRSTPARKPISRFSSAAAASRSSPILRGCPLRCLCF
jgi:hypothetical protein